jgi:Fe-S cluster biosynthesis and repair protein YggX
MERGWASDRYFVFASRHPFIARRNVTEGQKRLESNEHYYLGDYMAHMVKCIKMGREMEGLDEPPFDGELGQRIYDNVSKLAWEQWQEHMKMLLNEYRLQPWKKDHQEFIVQQMQAYFFGEGSEKPQEYVPPAH